MWQTILSICAYWLTVLVLNVILFCVQMFVFIELLELTKDRINSFTLESRVQDLVKPDHICQIFMTVLYIVGGHYYLALFCSPLCFYHLRRLFKGIPLFKHAFGDSSVMRQLPAMKRVTLVKLLYYTVGLILLLWTLFSNIADGVEKEEFRWLVSALVSSHLPPGTRKAPREHFVAAEAPAPYLDHTNAQEFIETLQDQAEVVKTSYDTF